MIDMYQIYSKLYYKLFNDANSEHTFIRQIRIEKKKELSCHYVKENSKQKKKKALCRYHSFIVIMQGQRVMKYCRGHRPALE